MNLICCCCCCCNIINWSNCYFRTDIPEDELDEIISSIHAQFNSNETEASISADDKSTMCTTAVEDRKLRNLRKKLDQIEVLKERLLRGDELEANQVCSIIWINVIANTVDHCHMAYSKTDHILVGHVNFRTGIFQLHWLSGNMIISYTISWPYVPACT